VPVDTEKWSEGYRRKLSEAYRERQAVDFDEEGKVKKEGDDNAFQYETVVCFIPANLRAMPTVPALGSLIYIELFVLLVII